MAKITPPPAAADIAAAEAAAAAAAAEAEAAAAAAAAEAEAAAEAAAAAAVDVRVLIDCAYGKCNAVASIPAAELSDAKAAGQVDDNPDAVEYARSLQA